jgi:triphosphoribosyl-dephospho-CoA synthase
MTGLSHKGVFFPLLSTAQSAWIGDLAAASLLLEVEIWPKPGLASHVDCGSHTDMHAGTFRASAGALHPFFVVLASAGGTGMDELRAIGLLADAYLAASATYSDMTWRERRQRMPWTDR